MTANNLPESMWLAKQICRVCGKEKPRIDFANGMKLTCLECKREQDRKRFGYGSKQEARKSQRRWVCGALYI